MILSTRIRSLRQYSLGVLTFLALLVSQSLQGQQLAYRFSLSISEPASIAGDYDILTAAFGPGLCNVDMFTAELALVQTVTGNTLACDSVANDLTGKIAVLDRGSCDFSLKALNAQKKGAIAVIVCNNVANPEFVFMGAGTLGDQVTIPVFSMRQSDCNNIRVSIPGGVTATIQPPPLGEFPEEEVIWGANPGEGDFDGGLNGWTVNNLNCGGQPAGSFELWRHDPFAEAPNGSCSVGTLFSPSKCNGAMVFESDFYDNGGTDCSAAAAGTGPCPSFQIGELISPNIDVSNAGGTAFTLRFFQDTRQFQSTYWVGWSTDNGVTWDSTEINTDIAVNDFNTPDQSIVRVPLTGTAGASTIKVKFRYEADYYYWIIDDVQIVAQEANNLRVNDNFFAIPQNVYTPASQVEPIRFLADIENIGSATQTNTALDVFIIDTTGNLLFNSTLDYGDVPANTLVENQPFEQTFTPPGEGIYLGRYLISSDQEDADITNNFQDFVFAVTDTVFAKEDGPTILFSWNPALWNFGERHGTAIGNHFFVKNGGEYVRSISFGIGNADEIAGQSLIIALYKWVDTNQNGDIESSERELLDFNFYVVQGTESPGDLITIPFPEDIQNPIQLESNTGYLVMVEYTPSDQNPEQDFLPTWSDDFDYGAMIFANALANTPRFAGIVGFGGELSDVPYGPISDFAPVVRLNIGANPATSTDDLNVLENQFAVFPNPASEDIHIRLSLEETAQNATIRILDTAGRTMLERTYSNVQREQMDFRLRNWKNGAYFVQVITEKGAGTQRFVLAR